MCMNVLFASLYVHLTHAICPKAKTELVGPRELSHRGSGPQMLVLGTESRSSLRAIRAVT